MAQSLKSINLVAPGFKGINTEDSPLSIDPNYAATADNCVIDRYGRIASRKGYSLATETATELGADYLHKIGVYRDSSGVEKIFHTGNNKILSGTTTLVDETPVSYTITDDDWRIINFNNNLYFFNRGHEPLVYNNSLGAVTEMSSVSGASGTPPQGKVAMAAWGRLWVADFTGDKSTIYWSDTLIGHVWDTGTSGSIDISGVWPDGYDEIVDIAAHNNLLIIFGRHSIVVYEGASDPSTMSLVDTVSGVGAVHPNAIAYTGADVLFMAKDGLRSFGRTIQEKSMPINTLSKTIKQDIIRAVAAENEAIELEYSPEDSFVLALFRSQGLVYCFDTRGELENGAWRVTRWPGAPFKTFHRDSDGTFYVGVTGGIGEHTGYTDNGSMYLMKYYSPNITFGDPSRLKMLKKMRPTVIGGSGVSVTFRWGYDFSGSFKSFVVDLSSSEISEYGIAEYGISEYSSGVVSRTSNINTTGDGASVVVGLEASINGSSLSMQEFNIWSLLGKLI